MLLTATGLVVLVATVARADTEPQTLAKYQPAVDQAVGRALAWLARTQQPDGAFDGPYGETNAATGLVGMAFLSKGYRPGFPPYGDTINRCIDRIVSTASSNGYLGVRGGRMYGHGIATVFLSEVSGMADPARQKQIDATLPTALRVILDAQKVPKEDGRHRGGWRYEPTDNSSDISITGWSLMALRSARLNGAPVPVSAINDAVGFIDRCRNPDNDGGFFYSPGRFTREHPFRGGLWLGGPSTPARTGAALLCRELAGRRDNDVNRGAGDFILRDVKNHGFIKDTWHEYATYYCSQGMFQLGGTYWEQFAPAMYNYLLLKQQANGAWRTNYW